MSFERQNNPIKKVFLYGRCTCDASIRRQMWIRLITTVSLQLKLATCNANRASNVRVTPIRLQRLENVFTLFFRFRQNIRLTV